LSSLVEVVTIFWPRRYKGFAPSEPTDLFASDAVLLAPSLFASEFLAAKVASGLLWSSETSFSTALDGIAFGPGVAAA
jgi:hypothetical protein